MSWIVDVLGQSFRTRGPFVKSAMKGLAALFPLLVWVVTCGFLYYANHKLGRGISIKKVPYRYFEPG